MLGDWVVAGSADNTVTVWPGKFHLCRGAPEAEPDSTLASLSSGRAIFGGADAVVRLRDTRRELRALHDRAASRLPAEQRAALLEAEVAWLRDALVSRPSATAPHAFPTITSIGTSAAASIDLFPSA